MKHYIEPELRQWPYSITYPCKDEFAAGHVGRFARLNGYSSSTQLIRFMDRTLAPQQDVKQLTPAYLLLASAIGMDSHEYVRRHSLIPFHTLAIASESEYGDFHERAGAFQPSVFQHYRGERAYLCEKCVSEDLSTLGFSYWRRMHQIPGLNTCISHGQPLHYITGRMPFDVPPDACLARVTRVDAELIEVSAHPLIVQYARIAEMVLDRANAICRIATARLVRERWLEKVKLSGNLANPPSLCDMVRTSFPALWIDTYLGDIEHTWGSKIHSPFLKIMSAAKGVIGFHYVLAFAVLYDEPKNAEADLYEPPGARAFINLAKRPKIGYSILMNAFIECKGNVRAMSDRLNCTRLFIYRNLDRYGIPKIDLFEEAYRDSLIRVLMTANADQLADILQAGRQYATSSKSNDKLLYMDFIRKLFKPYLLEMS